MSRTPLIPKPLLRIGTLVWALAAISLAPASAQTATCPVDGVRLPLPPQMPWNDAGGLDSDGCRWSVDADGAWRVAGLDEVVACTNCQAAFRFDHLGLTLRPDEVARVRAAVNTMVQSGVNGADTVGRFRLAASVYGALGDRLVDLELDPGAFLGELHLKAAWAARAKAVLPDFDPGYRPRTLPLARATLQELENGMRRGRRDQSGVAPLLLQVERLRALVDALGEATDPTYRLLSDRLTEDLMRLEQRLHALRSELPDEEDESAWRSYLSLARVCARYGEPARRRAWLATARARFGRVVESEASAFEAACQEESDQLLLAHQAFAAAAELEGKSPEARARLHFLAGDTARRRGDKALSAKHLGEALEAAPASAAGQRAAFLLGVD